MKDFKVFLLGMVLALGVGCSGFESSSGNNATLGSLNSQSTSTGNLGTMTASIDASHSLGESQSYQIQFLNSSNYSGLVSFSVDRSMLSSLTGQEDISISLNPTELNVTAGEQVNLVLNIDTPYRSPSFSARQLFVTATGSGGQNSELVVPLSVSAIVQIQVNQCDYQNNTTLDQCWNVPASMDLRPHNSGVIVEYINCDPTTSHVIHGNGVIPHQRTTQPLPQALSSTDCRGSYRVQVLGSETGSGTYYMHGNQGSGQSRRINFGVQNPMVAQAASVADDFDRGPSNAGSCHDPIGEE